ncbi:hypothetical protein [Stenotrophomonas sp.]|uniref:hypothetical protein n=1 Tax=Stenotrophomonas sp. TaxID=69392 RepID=UPI0028B00FCE|nr:hypothetical protein [Stenotrophomonas sp.]
MAEQVANFKNPSRLEKIVDDQWATGMDEAKASAQGIELRKADLTTIDVQQDKATVPDYLHSSRVKGRIILFSFGAMTSFKNLAVNMVYASQVVLGLPDIT